MIDTDTIVTIYGNAFRIRACSRLCTNELFTDHSPAPQAVSLATVVRAACKALNSTATLELWSRLRH